MFISDAMAQAVPAVAPQASVVSTVVQLALIFAIFYILLIRPQQKKMKQHEIMLAAVKKGDKVITGGGIIGTVTKDTDDKLEVKIAENVTISVFRATIRDVINEETMAAAPKAPQAKKASSAVEKK